MARNGSGETANTVWKRLSPALDGRYAFVDWLGAGAFGDVLLARQLSTGQQVAIKVLRTHDDNSSRLRFLREMRACAALDHANIVRVIDAGGDADSGLTPLFTVFEYVPGETLAQRLLDHGALPVAQAIDLMLQVLDGLRAAHDAGVVHRDLKPANIMMSEVAGSLRAKVLDFGIAALIDDSNGQTRLTLTGDRLGTPAYCAPEQLQGYPASAGADYYAWGLVLLEAITGAPAWQRATLPEVLSAQFSHEPVPLPPVLAGHRLGELLRWTLEKNPARRVSDPRYLIEQLRRVAIADIVDSGGFLSTPDGSLQHGPVSSTTDVAPLAPARGERRPAVAMCCRVELARPLPAGDEEGFDEWLADLRDMAARIAQAHGGSLVGCAGVEILLYFGLGSGEEASTNRATRAALLIRDQSVRRSSLMHARAGWCVDIRIGLHQGMVTLHAATDPAGVGWSSASAIASRLCSVAIHGEIAASESVYARLHGTAQAERKTDAAGDVWYSVLSAAAQARSASDWERVGTTIGRERELQQLRAAWERQPFTSVRRVLLVGPAGIGKTHLTRLWQDQLDREGVRVLAARCVSEGSGNALQPVLTLLGNQLGFQLSDPQHSAQVLAEALHEHGIAQRQRAIGLACAWFGVTTNPPVPLDLSPKKRRDEFLALTVQLTLALASVPTLLVIEDLQWADPTTVEWLCRLANKPCGKQLLLLSTVRTGNVPLPLPEGEPSPGTAPDGALGALLGDDDVIVIDLPRLSDQSARELVLGVWQEPTPTEAALAPVLERAAGVPLFLLELARCRALLSELPASMAELLRVRIDQLGRARETAQLAAVIAPEFELDLLVELSQRRTGLLGDLQHLQTAGILHTPREGVYAFSHSLFRDSAYQSLPRKDRRRLHAAVASVLKTRNPELEAQRPWTLALHHWAAGEAAEASRLGVAAATLALMRFDNLEALGHIKQMKGVATPEGTPRGWLNEVENAERRTAVELQLLSVETTALMLTRGWADEELNGVCARATQLFEQSPLESTVQLRYALAQFYFNRGFSVDANAGRERALRYIGDLIDTARRCDASALSRLGCMMLGAWHLFSGDLQASLETLRRVQGTGEASDAWMYGFDALIGARSVECMTRWFTGDAEVAHFSDETMRLAAALQHQASYAIALLYRGSLFQLMQDRPETLRVCTELLGLCERHGLQGYPGYALILLGWANNDPDLAQRARHELTLAGQGLAESYYGAMIAQAELECGRLDASWQRLQHLREAADASGEHFCLPELFLLSALCARRIEGLRETADAYFLRALEIALEQQSYGACRSILTRYSPDPAKAATLERVNSLLATARPDQASLLRALAQKSRG